jgi:hypothetical protein
MVAIDFSAWAKLRPPAAVFQGFVFGNTGTAETAVEG